MEQPVQASREIDNTSKKLFADAVEKTLALHSAYDVLDDFTELSFSHPDYEHLVLRREVVKLSPETPTITSYMLTTSALGSTERGNSLETVENFQVGYPHDTDEYNQPTSYYYVERYSGDDIEEATQADVVVQSTQLDPRFSQFIELGEELDQTEDPKRREELTDQMTRLSAERSADIATGVELGMQDDNIFTPNLLEKALNVLLNAQPAELPEIQFGQLTDFTEAVDDSANKAEDRLPHIRKIALLLGQLQLDRAKKRREL